MRNARDESPVTDVLSEVLLIILNPVLIMLMVGSLVFFLLQINYQGEFQARVHYVFALFVFATVLIARIAIENGVQHAMPFGLALAVAVGLVLLRFELSGVATIVFVATVWWCVHRLTADCTVLEDQPEGPGEGLMKSLGMDQEQLVYEGTVRVQPKPRERTQRSMPAWTSWVIPSGHAHAPGASVVWFAIAAIPIFGFGSMLAPAAVTHRQYAFRLFCAYLAAALCLLMSTSLMSLRKHLARRQIAIAPDMVGNWIFTGALLVIALLCVTTLLPRPGAEYAISQVPDLSTLRAQNPTTTEWAAGAEGIHDPQHADREGPARDRGEPGGLEGVAGPAQANGSRPGGPPARSGMRKRKGESESPAPSGRSGSQPGDPSGNGSQGGTSPDRSSAQGGRAGNGSSRTQGSSSGAPPPEGKGDNRSSTAETPQPEAPDRGDPSESGSGRSPRQRAPSPPPTPPQFPSLTGLVELLRLLAYLALALFVLLMAWRHRKLIVTALRDFCGALAQFWNGLWGRTQVRHATSEPQAVASAACSFAECQDPFLHSVASPTAIVQATLEGLEAWAWEHGTPRKQEQTLEEFVRELVHRQTRWPEALPTQLNVLVGLHDHVAYAGRRLTVEQVQPLRQLWQTLRSHQVRD